MKNATAIATAFWLALMLFLWLTPAMLESAARWLVSHSLVLTAYFGVP